MENDLQHAHGIRWRALGLVLSGLVLTLSITQLILRPGEDSGMWRGIALSSLYLALCLAQRRLFSGARTRGNRGAWR